MHRTGDATREPDADREGEEHAREEQCDQDDAQLVGIGE